MHRCACRIWMPESKRHDCCGHIVKSDDEPYCEGCIHNAAHHLSPNFDPVPADLLHTLRVTYEDEPPEITMIGEATLTLGDGRQITLSRISFTRLDESGQPVQSITHDEEW